MNYKLVFIVLSLTVSVFGAVTYKAAQSSNHVELKVQHIQETIKEQGAMLEFSYPYFIDEFHNTFNKAVIATVEQACVQFKELLPDALRSEEGPIQSTLSGEYTIEYQTQELISVTLSVYSYVRGAAHGAHAKTTLNYDLKNQKVLSLKDIFKPNSNYLEIVAHYCIEKLIEKLKQEDGMVIEEWVREGAGPQEHNYKNWLITPKGLKILFSEYQVACYASGPQEIVIPYSYLQEIIAPLALGPIAQFIAPA